MSEFSQVDPENLIVQEGDNAGNIADVELARIGAEAEHKMRKEVIGAQRKMTSGMQARDAINAGKNAVNDQLRRRTEELMPESGDMLKGKHDYASERRDFTAHDKIVKEFNDLSEDKRESKLKEKEDERKARGEEIIDSLDI